MKCARMNKIKKQSGRRVGESNISHSARLCPRTTCLSPVIKRGEFMKLLNYQDFYVLDSYPRSIRFLWKNRSLYPDNRLRYIHIRYLIRELRAVRERYKGEKVGYVLQ